MPGWWAGGGAENVKPHLLGQARVSSMEGRLSKMNTGTLAGRGHLPGLPAPATAWVWELWHLPPARDSVPSPSS